jgi:serine/threonine-protein kinase
VVPVTPDPGSEAQAALSPDGRWLAFTNDRSGRFEILLASYEDDGTRVKLGEQRIAVSAGGGVDPHWRKDGKEIVYYAADATIRSVSVTIAGNAVTLGRPTALPLATTDVGGSGSNWGVNSTHTQFVVVEAPRAAHQTFRVLLGK